MSATYVYLTSIFTRNSLKCKARSDGDFITRRLKVICGGDVIECPPGEYYGPLDIKFQFTFAVN